MSKLHIVEENGAGAFSRLRDEWQELFRASAAAPFMAWEWLATWHKHCGGHLTPRIFCVRQGDGRLLGLLPLGEARVRGLGVRRLVLLGQGDCGADYLDLLARRDADRKKVTKALFTHLMQEAGCDALELGEMATDTPTWLTVQELYGAHPAYRQHIALGALCPGISLTGAAYEQFKKRERFRNMRRQAKKLAHKDGYEWRVVQDAAEAPAAFARFCALHRQRWAQQGGSDALGTAQQLAFHREVVPLMARAGLLRFEELWAEGACRASNYAFEAHDTHYFYLSGADSDWAAYSVGLVNFGLAIIAAGERGRRRFDFLRGAETYKFDWATEMRTTMKVCIVKRRAPALAYLCARQAGEAAARLGKTILSDAWKARLQRLGRNRRPSVDDENKALDKEAQPSGVLDGCGLSLTVDH